MIRRFLGFTALLILLTTPVHAQVQKYICVVLDHDTGVLYDCDLTTG